MYVAPGPARNATTWPTSSAVAKRPHGIAWRVRSRCSSVQDRVRSVSTGPGATALTLMPYPARRPANDLVRLTMPALDAAYGASGIKPPDLAATDAILMIRPPP